jgi:hypothetical protein
MASSGIAACIATTRAIADQAALLFAREFYRTLLAGAGYSLERAITEARRALRQEGHDWAAYALFAGSTNLDILALTFVRGQDNQEQFGAPHMDAPVGTASAHGNLTSDAGTWFYG